MYITVSRSHNVLCMKLSCCQMKCLLYSFLQIYIDIFHFKYTCTVWRLKTNWATNGQWCSVLNLLEMCFWTVINTVVHYWWVGLIYISFYIEVVTHTGSILSIVDSFWKQLCIPHISMICNFFCFYRYHI